MTGPKRTDAEREAHLRVMERSLLEGVPSEEIVPAAAKKYGITERQVRYDITEIHRRWDAAGEELAQRKHSQCSLMRALLRREHLYRLAVQSGELSLALAAEKDRAVLAQLYKDRPADDPGGTCKVYINFDPEDEV